MTHIEEPAGGGAAAPTAPPLAESGTVAEIIAEFSEIFAFARTKWARYAEEIHADLRGAGMMVLQLVIRKGPITATGISQLLDMDKAMVSRQISKLRELDLVIAESAAEDRRVILLTASERAEELLDGIRQQWAHSYHERFDGWSAADLETLRSGLRRFNASAGSSRPDGPARRCAREHAPDAHGAQHAD